ncbi:MAG: proton-conducting transporter membrane subunit [Ignisphaera sp.]|uniref:NADH:quinone oxidoreductase/Mrp antiporter transmembrane domain-containing protein n=1 Tax=Ignisphaera aggregans TaxID=334771 RepID=A0A7J3I894_9CREN
MEMNDLCRYLLYSLSTVVILIGNAGTRSRFSVGLLKISGYLMLLSLNLIIGYGFFQSILLLTSILVSLIVSLYTAGYSSEKYGSNSLQLLVDGLTISIIATLSSKYLLEFVMFWLMSEIIGFLAIAYNTLVGIDTRAMNASLKYLIFSMIPTDIALFLILAVSNFENILTITLLELNLDLASPALTITALLGFMAKAAIVPLHFWLPDAHSMAPAPISALLSGIMVKMGIYGFVILSHFAIDAGTAFSILFVFGSLAAVYGALQAIYQRDIKRLLAYSTISNTGVIAILIAFYIKSADPTFIYAALTFSVAHALYKATLFIDSGVIELLTHERNIDSLGYIYRVAPIESLSAILSILFIFGMPPAIGFLAKVLIFSALLHYIAKDWIYLFTIIIISIETSLTILYSAKYLLAHIRIHKNVNTLGTINLKALGLSPYVLLLTMTSIALTPIVLLVRGSTPLPIEIDIIILYIITFPLLLFILLALYTVFKQSRV